MLYVEATDEIVEISHRKRLFLGGGISGCPNWQKDLILRLSGTDLIILNPRRESWPVNLSPNEEAEKQIRWEHRHLLMADAITFWFPAASLCPIVLYELGAWLHRNKKVFVGCEPGYSRTFDVQMQAKLERLELEIVHSLEDMAEQIVTWEKSVSTDK